MRRGRELSARGRGATRREFPHGTDQFISAAATNWAPMALAATDSTHRSLRGRTVDQLIGEPLVIPLAVVMGDEFSQSPTKVPLAERDESIQALLFHRSDKSFCMRVAGRRTRKIRATVRATRSGPASSMLVPTKTGYVL